jgi:hypothetical protein
MKPASFQNEKPMYASPPPRPPRNKLRNSDVQNISMPAPVTKISGLQPYQIMAFQHFWNALRPRQFGADEDFWPHSPIF